jgi:hypothetical protein
MRAANDCKKIQSTPQQPRNSTPFITTAKQHPSARTTNSKSKLTAQLYQCYNSTKNITNHNMVGE